MNHSTVRFDSWGSWSHVLITLHIFQQSPDELVIISNEVEIFGVGLDGGKAGLGTTMLLSSLTHNEIGFFLS